VEPEKTPRNRADNLIRLLVPDWRPTALHRLWAIRIGIVLGLLVAIGYSYGITLWDWIKLLIVPAAIAGAGLWFNRQQRERELEIAREQRERDVGIAYRRAQDEALQAYLDQIGNLLLAKDGPLRQSKEGDETRTLARARTLTVLKRLTGERKARVVQFLYEAGLIAKSRPIVDLAGADLGGAHLFTANLVGADLSEADLRAAYLTDADLSEANLRGANLGEANLNPANLSGADLSEAILGGANLILADLSEADLRGARLFKADLSGANLRGANASGACLESADLAETDLTATNLSDAQHITSEELVQQASILAGATMPNGQKYEEWLKSRGEENSGS